MIFSDKTIRKFIASGEIKVLPDFRETDIRPVGIRLHLGKELLIPVKGQTIDLDRRDDVMFQCAQIPEEGYILRSDAFVLGTTYERVQVPRNVVSYIDGRSTIARIGLSIHCTSGTIDGNFEEARTVVLEMKNQGPFNIVLRFKMAIAMLSFHQLTTEIEQQTQKQYQGQEGVVAPNLKGQKR